MKATIKRIEKIYDLLGRGGYWSTQELTDALGWPKGTLSPLMSYLLATKNVICHNTKYKLPDFPKSFNVVANDINKERNARFGKSSRKSTLDTFLKNPEPLNLFKGEEFETIQVQIEMAIELLKTHGYKILKASTVFDEV